MIRPIMGDWVINFITSMTPTKLGYLILISLVVAWGIDNIAIKLKFKSKETEAKILKYLNEVQVNDNAENKIKSIMISDMESLKDRDIDIRFYEIPKGKDYRKKYKGNPVGAVVKVYIRVENIMVYSYIMKYDTRRIFNILDDYCTKQRRARNIYKERKDKTKKYIIRILIESLLLIGIIAGTIVTLMHGVIPVML